MKNFIKFYLEDIQNIIILAIVIMFKILMFITWDSGYTWLVILSTFLDAIAVILILLTYKQYKELKKKGIIK